MREGCGASSSRGRERVERDPFGRAARDRRGRCGRAPQGGAAPAGRSAVHLHPSAGAMHRAEGRVTARSGAGGGMHTHAGAGSCFAWGDPASLPARAGGAGRTDGPTCPAWSVAGKAGPAGGAKGRHWRRQRGHARTGGSCSFFFRRLPDRAARAAPDARSLNSASLVSLRPSPHARPPRRGSPPPPPFRGTHRPAGDPSSRGGSSQGERHGVVRCVDFCWGGERKKKCGAGSAVAPVLSLPGTAPAASAVSTPRAAPPQCRSLRPRPSPSLPVAGWLAPRPTSPSLPACAVSPAPARTGHNAAARPPPPGPLRSLPASSSPSRPSRLRRPPSFPPPPSTRCACTGSRWRRPGGRWCVKKKGWERRTPGTHTHRAPLSHLFFFFFFFFFSRPRERRESELEEEGGEQGGNSNLSCPTSVRVSLSLSLSLPRRLASLLTLWPVVWREG